MGSFYSYQPQMTSAALGAGQLITQAASQSAEIIASGARARAQMTQQTATTIAEIITRGAEQSANRALEYYKANLAASMDMKRSGGGGGGSPAKMQLNPNAYNGSGGATNPVKSKPSSSGVTGGYGTYVPERRAQPAAAKPNVWPGPEVFAAENDRSAVTAYLKNTPTMKRWEALESGGGRGVEVANPWFNPHMTTSEKQQRGKIEKTLNNISVQPERLKNEAAVAERLRDPAATQAYDKYRNILSQQVINSVAVPKGIADAVTTTLVSGVKDGVITRATISVRSDAAKDIMGATQRAADAADQALAIKEAPALVGATDLTGINGMAATSMLLAEQQKAADGARAFAGLQEAGVDAFTYIDIVGRTPEDTSAGSILSAGSGVDSAASSEDTSAGSILSAGSGVDSAASSEDTSVGSVLAAGGEVDPAASGGDAFAANLEDISQMADEAASQTSDASDSGTSGE